MTPTDPGAKPFRYLRLRQGLALACAALLSATAWAAEPPAAAPTTAPVAQPKAISDAAAADLNSGDHAPAPEKAQPASISENADDPRLNAKATNVTPGERPILRIGVTAFALPGMKSEVVQSAQEGLDPLLGRYDIRWVPMTVAKLEDAVRTGKVDMVLASSGFGRRLADTGLRPLATSVSERLPNPNANEGSAVVVRRDRNDLKTVDDLKDKRIAANHAGGFSGWLIFLGELAERGFDTKRFFRETIFFHRQDSLVPITAAVIDGRADAGVLRLCSFEEFAALHPSDAAKLRVLAPVKDGAACQHTTKLYPAHTMAALPHVSPEAVTAVTLALLELQSTETGRSWALATDFYDVDNLIKALKLGPYSYLDESIWVRAWGEHKGTILACLGALLLLLVQYRRTQTLLVKREKEVADLMRKEADREKRLLFLEKNTAVSQLSSMLAHELHQPLSAIRLYTQGLARLIARTRAPEAEEIGRVVSSVARETDRAKAIVERVRAYARNRKAPRETVDVKPILMHAAANFQKNSPDIVPVQTKVAGSCFVNVCPLELELIILNLLKNAREAALTNPEPDIDVTLERTSETVRITIRDNGLENSELSLSRIKMTAAQSDKPEGLGLGLGIVRNLVEQYGRIDFYPAEGGPGIVAVLELPLIGAPGE